MASVDVPVALLGYGTVGAAVNRMLVEGGDDIERATGHRLRVVQRARPRRRAGARLPPRGRRPHHRLRRDPRRPLDRARRRGDGRPRADRRLRARACCAPASRSSPRTSSSSRGAAPSSSRPRRRPACSCASRRRVCAAIPVIKVLRESLVVDERPPRARHRQRDDELHPHADGGAATTYDEALAEAQRLGYAEADPTEDVNGADAAAKMAILATVAFGSRVALDDVAYEGIEAHRRRTHVRAARALEHGGAAVGTATLVDGARRRPRPAGVRRPAPPARRRRRARSTR